MAFKEITGVNAIDIKKHKGDPFVGVYLGSKVIQTKIGNQFIYRFQNEDGIFGVYGFTNLNMAMESVTSGTLCRLTYTGTQLVDTKKFGKKDVHQVKVEIDTNGQ